MNIQNSKMREFYFKTTNRKILLKKKKFVSMKNFEFQKVTYNFNDIMRKIKSKIYLTEFKFKN